MSSDVFYKIRHDGENMLCCPPGETDWKPAVRHDSIREELIKSAQAKDGSYEHPRAKGTEANDITCFHPYHRFWCADEDSRPEILFQFDPEDDWGSINCQPKGMMHDGKIVLDIENRQVRDFYEMPLTISTQIEGWFVEALIRLNPLIRYSDFISRMPSTSSQLATANVLNMRASRWRIKNWCTSWTKKDGTQAIRDYMWDRMTAEQQARNSTKGMDIATPAELKEIESLNKGKLNRGKRGQGKRARETEATGDTTESDANTAVLKELLDKMVGTVRRLADGGSVEWFDPDRETWRMLTHPRTGRALQLLTYSKDAAVYHDDIRDSLIAQASALGAYRYPHGTGTLPNDTTSYKEEQRDWGADRAHWPPILYQYEPTKPAPRTPRPSHWKTEAGDLILDIVNNPLLDYAELPHTISSCEKPAFLEAWLRSNSRIVMKDIRARMLQDPRGDWDGGVDPIRSGTLGMRMTRLRETHGMISWRRKKGSDQIKNYLDSLLPQACKDANSIKDFRVLHPHEKYALHLNNIGQMPERGHANGKDLSDKKKAAVNREARAKYESLKAAFEEQQAAGTYALGHGASSSSETELEALLDLEERDEDDAAGALRNLDLGAEYDNDDWLSSLQPRNQANVNDNHAGAGVGEPGSASASREESSPTNDAENSERNEEIGFLDLQAIEQVHQDLLFQLLAPTRRHFATLTGHQPTRTTPTASYHEQWDELQMELEEHWDAARSQGQEPDLVGLARLTRAEIRWNNPAEARAFPADTMILIARLLVDFE
ncbi:hypothetical protein MMC18_006323 [Xylographa bjoerkii]|nr:hypothetical protein [Xylographa bjoerkii]